MIMEKLVPKFYKPLRISSVLELMKPWFFVYKLHGLFPYKILKTDIKLSKTGFSFSILIGIVSIIYLIVLFYQCIVSEALKFDTVEGLLQFYCYFIFTTFIYVQACFSCKNRLPLLKKIMEVSSMLPVKEIHQLLWLIYVKDVIGYFFLLAQSPNVYEKEVAESLSKAFGLYMTIVVFLLNSYYSNSILILRSCFKSINNDLYELKGNASKTKVEFVKNVDNFSKFQDSVKLARLRKIELRYSEVSNVVQKLNSVFAIEIIATVIYVAGEVTFGLYFFILHSQGKKGIDVEKQIWYNYFITSVTYHSIKIIIIVWVCQTAKNESSESGLIVHDIILDSEDEPLKSELNMFSLQLLQHNNDFTAKCITINGRLLTAIVSGIATYLLILIQFLNTKNSLEVDDNSEGNNS